MNEFPALKVALKTGDELFHRDGQSLDIKLLDFWRWSASDLVNNALRGVLAEFIVASALGLAHNARVEWDVHDLLTFDGVKIEVKSAAYLQSWQQKALSKISFTIRPTQNLNEGLTGISQRQSQIYVFCLLHHQDKITVDPLDLEQWMFYLLPTQILNAKKPTQKSLTLSALLKLRPRQVKYQEIAASVEALLLTD